jgi:hypothetical protein
VRSPVDGVVLKVAQTSEGPCPRARLAGRGRPAADGSDRRTAHHRRRAGAAGTPAPSSSAGARPWWKAGCAWSIRAAFTKVSGAGIEEQRVKVVGDIASPPPAWQGHGRRLPRDACA